MPMMSYSNSDSGEGQTSSHRARLHKGGETTFGEPNTRLLRAPGWLKDDLEDAAIMLRGVQMRKWGKGRGFVWVEVASYVVFSCYISPNITAEEYERQLDDLENCVRMRGASVVVTGDFNAKAFMWGSEVEDARGRKLADWAAGMNLVAMNEGEPTFERGGSTSVLDVTFCSPDVARRVHGVHMPIEFEIAERHIATEAGCPAHGWRWAENKKDKLAEQMNSSKKGVPPEYDESRFLVDRRGGIQT
ncbi:hypothetical protein GEV33_006133 [Tenebrio molitor]|uniref:Endonuclease/exonuclease/phosphatase domain-containing protein n=1 Tax=Tenebrio molitor TaxID=7067 RepID=A0A8J6HLV4_TENMO|nr:hypothetical protein GEV33_006133 [Tenebrio molitor]